MSSSFDKIKSTLPYLGVGLGLRREVATETFEAGHVIDFLEVIPEQYLCKGGDTRERLNKARASMPLVVHGLNLSLGGASPLDQEYIARLKTFVQFTNAPWFSDHVAFASLGDLYLHELLPVPFCKETIAHMSRRIKMVKEQIEKPFLIENTTYYMSMPGTDMTEPQFLTELLEEADCGLLLDVNNVYVNSVNHGFDPYLFLDQLPLERVVQIHMAGHLAKEDIVLDTHGAPIADPVFDLLRYVLSKTTVCGITLERDQNLPPFDEILAELSAIKTIAAKAKQAKTSLELEKQP